MATTRFGAGRKDSLQILGVPIDRVTMAEALSSIEAFVWSGKPHLVITADANAILIARGDPEFRALITNAGLVTPDGTGVVWAARRMGQPLPERVSGVDLLDRVCALSADKGYRLFFLGGQVGVAELAAEKLRLKHPGCNIVGTRHGFFPAESDEVVAREVAESKPDILFVGLGMPRQEKFIAATTEIVGAKVSVGVGGSFDVFSGKTKRAPNVFQRLQMEWLWRLMLDPSKMKKVKRLPKFIYLVWRDGR
ncbi:MAG: WecB/TagA/CpsF family glycosyltransferase [Fimbriimonas sp.]|nr:WecB/TagA/CpsF family glycosyltransferase [Fimbriimonas sp.]